LEEEDSMLASSGSCGRGFSVTGLSESIGFGSSCSREMNVSCEALECKDWPSMVPNGADWQGAYSRSSGGGCSVCGVTCVAYCVGRGRCHQLGLEMVGGSSAATSVPSLVYTDSSHINRSDP
jgi:hypothetical protein